MDCTRCRSLLSDFVEKSLPPRTRAEVVAHVATCPACAADAQGLEKTLALVRAAPSEEPPAGLAGAVVARLGREADAIAARELRSRAFAGTMRRVAAAAALVFLGLTIAAVLRETWWRTRLGDADARVASARTENETLRGELAAAQGRIVSSAEDAATALQAVKDLQHELAQALARFKDESVAHDRNIAALTESLAASRKETQRLEAEVARLSVARATSDPRVTSTTPPPSGSRAPAEPRLKPGARGDSPTGVAAASPKTLVATEDAKTPPSVEAPLSARRHVVFVARGEALELRTRGPRDRVIGELFEVAADETNPATAGLALNALENLLGRGMGRSADAAGQVRAAGIMGWFAERFEGAGDRGATAPVDESKNRRLLLEELEESWRQERTSSQE